MDRTADSERLEISCQALRRRLISLRTPQGSWTGNLSSSPLATAAAVSALVVAERHIDNDLRIDGAAESSWLSGVLFRTELSELVSQSLCWLAERQNDDGGWGDAEGAPSTLTSTLMVQAAFRLTGVPARHDGALERADSYSERAGGAWALRKRSPRDKSLASAVLVNCALANMIPWRKSLVASPESLWLPSLITRRFYEETTGWEGALRAVVEHARQVHAPPRNPLTRAARRRACRRALLSVERWQGADGSFADSSVATSFVVMSMASVGLFDHPVARRGIEFLLTTVRGDGSWAVGFPSELGRTSQAIATLQWDIEGPLLDVRVARAPAAAVQNTLDWLLSRLHAVLEPTTHDNGSPSAPSGGRPPSRGAESPSTVAASWALLALAVWHRQWPDERRDEVRDGALRACHWLLRMQNVDGGWATCMQGTGRTWGSTSSADATSAALRALKAWRSELLSVPASSQMAGGASSQLEKRIDATLQRGLERLQAQQSEAGDWGSAWHVDAHNPEATNLVLGTCDALLALDDLGQSHCEAARRGALWLAGVQHASGGWGPVPARSAAAPSGARGTRATANGAKSRSSEQGRSRGGRSLGGHFERTAAPRTGPHDATPLCTVEETAAAVDALARYVDADRQIALAAASGVQWLCEAVQIDGSLPAASAVNVDAARARYADEAGALVAATRALLRNRRIVVRRRPAAAMTAPS